MSKINYIIKIVFGLLFSTYLFATKQWIGGIILAVIMILNIKWLLEV